MTYTGLIGKIKEFVALAALSVATANAQPFIDLSVKATDTTNNQVVAANGSLRDSIEYRIDVDLTGLNNPNVQPSSVLASLKLLFSNGATDSSASFGYTPSPTPAGVPATNDLFNGFTMSDNTFNAYVPINTSNGTFKFSRTENSAGVPTLDLGETNKVATFYFTPNSSTGSIAFRFDATNSTTLNIADSVGPFGNANGDLRYFGQTDFNHSLAQVQYNFTAVPEPSTYALLAGGAALAGSAAYRGRRRKEDKKWL